MKEGVSGGEETRACRGHLEKKVFCKAEGIESGRLEPLCMDGSGRPSPPPICPDLLKTRRVHS